MRNGALFHFRPLACLALGLCAGITICSYLSGIRQLIALCLFAVFFAGCIYMHLPGPALLAAGCAMGIIRLQLGDFCIPPNLMAPFQHIRESLLDITAQLFGEEASIIQAMLWGYKGGLSDQVYSAYRGSGIAHVLALSGLHVSFMAGAIGRLTRRCRPKLRFYTAAAVLGTYCAIAAFPASLVRAALMSLCALYAGVCGRRYDMLSGISFAAGVILLFDPSALSEIGFQLSFSAVIAISLLMDKVYGLFSFLPKDIQSLISVAVCGTLGTLPLSVYYFHAVPIMGLFANVLILPAVPLAFVTAMAVSITGLAFPVLASLTAPVPAFLFRVITGAASAVSSLSFALKEAHIVPASCVFIYLGYLFISNYPLIKKQHSYALGSLMFAGALLCML